MSIKSKGRTYGRMIRRCTGLPLPISMQIGKMVAQNRNFTLSTFDLVTKIKEKFPEYFQATHYEQGCGCCIGMKYVLTGPKGVIKSSQSFDYDTIQEHYKKIQ
jgi:hypothetical protein